MTVTPRWMAPELSGVPHSDKSDVFSLMTVVWEIAAWNSSPFEEILNQMAVMSVVMNGGREEIPFNCPKKISQLINWGWRDDPALRPTTKQLAKEPASDVNPSFARPFPFL